MSEDFSNDPGHHAGMAERALRSAVEDFDWRELDVIGHMCALLQTLPEEMWPDVIKAVDRWSGVKS